MERSFTSLTLVRMTSYAEMRSEATKRRVCSSTSKISRTLPLAIFLRPMVLASMLVTTSVGAMFSCFVFSWWCLMLCRWSEVVRDVESGVCVCV